MLMQTLFGRPMYSPPLHRKLLPWAYALLFFLVAPLLIFYTAGYRYNTKKAAVEKHGTLILDSRPAGATITLNGTVDVDTTPATFQELIPGWHLVRVERPGYTPWEKTLEIRAERATFADRIHLFRSEPLAQLVHPGSIQTLAANAERDTLFALGPKTVSSTQAQLLLSRGRIGAETLLATAFTPALDPRWQPDSRAVYLDAPPGAVDTLVRVLSRELQATSTVGQGSWVGQDLLLTNERTLVRWNSRSGAKTEELLPTSTVARIEKAHIELKGDARHLVIQRTFSEQTLALPPGDWTFFDQPSTALLLRDGSRWLWIDASTATPKAVLLEASALRFAPADAQTNGLLLLRGNELAYWVPGQDTQLLIRQSNPIHEATWHRSGDVVFFSTDTTIEAIDIDERGGRRRQTLATFDHVSDFDLLGTSLYVAGTKDGQEGVWMLTIE